MPEEGRVLRRAVDGRHPVRIAHLGLGAFHRAHQAWYTQLANDAGGAWGIEAFTGRRPYVALALTAQDDLYTLIVRGDTDEAVVISSLSRSTDGADAARWREVLSDSAVVALTLTITEAGYLRGRDSVLDWDDEGLSADLELLVADDGGAAVTAPARIVDGLRARRRADGGPIAVVSCDNLSGNGRITHNGVIAVAERVDPALAEWIDRNVSFVSTMVDRIAPATTDDDIRVARRLTGSDDRCPVVGEPFTEWVLSGAFPSGRPDWEAGGARFVDDIEPFENRKLWLLNAGHSLLAYVGLLLGHETIADAVEDRRCLALLERLWTEAREVLDLPESEVDAAIAALLQRFSNRRIRHQLAQVAKDGSRKLPERVPEVMRRRRTAGLPVGEAGATIVAAWLLHLRDHRDEVSDAGAVDLVEQLPSLDRLDQVRAVLARLAPDLADDEEIATAIDGRLDMLADIGTPSEGSR